MYNAYITKLKNIRNHPNADRLNLAECFGNTVVIGKDYDEETLYIYFPTDGQLSEEIGGVAAAEAVSFDIALDEALFETVTVESSVLRGTVKADNTYDILGVALDYDVELVILTGNGRVTSIIINYVAESGPIEITATYHY